MSRFPLRSIVIPVLILAFGSFAPVTRPAMAQDAAVGFIQNVGTQALQVAGPQTPPTARIARFRQIFDTDFDLPDAARFVLGTYGRAFTPEQHQQFLALFRDYLAQAYSRRLAQYAGDPFRVTGSRPTTEGAIVTSQVVRRDGPPIELTWHVVNSGGRMLITDVYVDGVSMKVTHRNEFAAIIQRNGGRADALLAALRQQLASAQ